MKLLPHYTSMYIYYHMLYTCISATYFEVFDADICILSFGRYKIEFKIQTTAQEIQVDSRKMYIPSLE